MHSVVSKHCINMSDDKTEDSLPFFDLETHSCSLIIKIEDFSNETVHMPGEPAQLADYSIIEGQSPERFFLDLYANGITRDDKGYVTIVFQIAKPLLEPFYKYFEFSCVLGVIDCSKNRRFPKSYVFPLSPDWITDVENLFPTFTVDRLLKRDFLLSDQDDLLPGDCLSLLIDVTIRTVDYGVETPVEAVVQYSFAREETADGAKYYLHLDSKLAERLVEVSAYFERMSETPMVERKTRYMNVAEDEYPFLRDVCFIVMGAKAITVESISHVCQMYITADKYDIPVAIESCRNLLTTFLRAENDPATEEHSKENIPNLLELAETYNDVRLKENIETLLKFDHDDDENERYSLKRLHSNIETEWKLKLSCVSNDKNHSCFTFMRNVREAHRSNFYQ